MTYEMPPEGGGPGRPGAGRPGRGGVGRLPRYNGFRRRGPLVPTILALILAVIAFLIFANFYTDWLWYRSIGAANVFTTRLRTQATLFVVFGVLTGGTLALNAWIAFRFRPAFRGLSVEQQSLERYRVSVEPYRRFITPVVGVIIGLMAGSSAASQWRSWLLFRNSVPFGAKDPQFHMDVSFFAFRLPFYRYLLGFGFAIVLLSLVVTLAVNYLYGGIKIQTPGERLTPAARVHVSVLLGIFVLLKAVAYWFDRFSLVLDQHHLSGNTASSFTGASYTDIRAILPAKNILLGVALICAVLFFVNVWRKTWQLPALGLGLLVFSAVVIGGIYPATVQYFTVRPSEPVREAPYIQRNIDATRKAYDIADVTPQSYTPNGAITAKAAAAATAVTPDVRLLDPVKVQAAFQNKQQSRGYYNFADPLDIDRYIINGQELVSLVAVRELDPTRIGGSDQNWANLHTVYTHGFGFVAAAGNSAQADGTPSFYEKDVPPVGPITPTQPRVYFGEDSSNYAIVGARKGAKGQELDYADSTVVGGQVNTTYTGKGGVSVGSAFRKTLFAVKFKDSNLLLSSLVNSNSKILWDRTPRQRVEKAAPWLRLDGDPYPAVVNGRIVWILDGYTSTNGYPYAQRTALGDVTQDSFTQATTTSVVAQQQDSANYIRNSVKATVDAYDGTVTLYEWNQTAQPDPVLKVWEKAFPGSVKPDSAISPELRMHFRYPEDLFKIQRDILSRYHVLTASAFYGGQDFWAVPEDPTVDTNPPPQPPYYVQVQMPGQTAATFSLTTTLAPRAKTQAAAFMAVDSDPGSDYGKIRVLEFPTETNTPGPQQVQNNFEGSAEVSTTLSLLRTKGSTVLFGNLLTLPLAGVNGLLYVEPVYVARASGSASASFPLLQRVLVSYGESIGFKETLALSLDEVFSTTTPGGSTPPPVNTPQGENAALAQALADAQAAITAGQAALANNDFAAYGKAQKQLADAVAAAVAAQQALAPSSSPSATPGASSSTSSSPIASASG